MYKWTLALAFVGWSAALSAQGVLTGQVTDRAGEPLVGANVWVVEAKTGNPTNQNGVYQIDGLPPGAYTVRVSYVGYERVLRKTSIREGTSKTILHIQLEEEIVAFEELVVSATRAGRKTPFTYVDLGREELEENNLGQDVPFQLQWTPSTVVTSDAGTGIGYTGIWIRGTDPSRINVTINGIPLNDAESQQVFWVDLPDFLSSTEDVQIQRGVGTSTNGAGAFGATVNLNTVKFNPEPYATISGSTGSFGTWRGNLQAGTGLLRDHFTFEGRLSRITSDGYIDRAEAELSSYFLTGAYIDDKTMLRFNLFSGSELTYQAWNGVPEAFIDDPELRTYNSAGTEKEGEPYDNEVDDYTQTHYQLLFNRELSRNWHLNLAGHYTRGAGFFEQYKADQSLAGYGLPAVSIGSEQVTETDLIRRRWLDNNFYGATWAARYVGNGSRFQLTVGGAWSRYEGRHFGEVIWARFFSDGEIRHRYYDNDAEKLDLNSYAKVSYEIGDALNLFLDLQYRRVDYEFLGFDQDGSNVTQTDRLHFFNPKAGLYFRLSEQSSVYASFAVANREPNRDDYVDSSPVSRPAPERLLNTELGYERQWKKARVQANFYHMFYEDQLVLTGQLNDVGAYTRTNVPESYRLGVELNGAWQALTTLELSGNATLSRNRIRAFTEFVDQYDLDFNYLGQAIVEHRETDLGFSPSFIAAWELNWTPFAKPLQKAKHDFALALLGKYVGQTYLDNTGSEDAALDPYSFVDLRLSYALPLKRSGGSLELTFLLRNLLDTRYETNGWVYRYEYDGQLTRDLGLYPQAGRNFLAGVVWKL